MVNENELRVLIFLNNQQLILFAFQKSRIVTLKKVKGLYLKAVIINHNILKFN